MKDAPEKTTETFMKNHVTLLCHNKLEDSPAYVFLHYSALKWPWLTACTSLVYTPSNCSGNASAEHSSRNFCTLVTKQLRKTSNHNYLYFADKNLIKREMVHWRLYRKLKAHAGINTSQADHVTSNICVKLSFFFFFYLLLPAKST